ncbi:MAG: hypothetical protein HYY44_00030 [Deltaproteobacteria bacterium]|nr:hypothetical protein [Deltaproteobacteria bacterium]MBI4374296.1 hypothetical protein [Deltaproteobacteria bacterium]
MKKISKQTRRRKTAILVLMRLLLSAAALAVEPNPHDPELLNAVSNMRQKQENEEGSVVRVIQQPVVLQTQQVCNPVEQARQRIRELGDGQNKVSGSVTVEAGHGEVNVESNEGTINSAINVQVVNPNERLCP